jgi:hypothetical protein
MIDFYLYFDFKDAEFENTATIPLGGDQLTRVTFDSARSLRAGAHSRSDRLEQFAPVIEELFHVEQDLLEVRLIEDICFISTSVTESFLGMIRITKVTTILISLNRLKTKTL